MQEAASFVSFSDLRVGSAGPTSEAPALQGPSKGCMFGIGESAGQTLGFDPRVSQKTTSGSWWLDPGVTCISRVMTRPDPTRPARIKNLLIRPGPTREISKLVDPTRPDPTRETSKLVDPTRPDPTRPDPTRPDPTRSAKIKI